MTATLPRAVQPSVPALVAGPRRSNHRRLEAMGGSIAVLLALVAVWHLAVSGRSWLLFYDADSVLPALIHSSLTVGQAPHWSLSAVLFLPETALYLLVTLVAPGVKAALAINGALNFLLLYGALRWTARLALTTSSRAQQVAGSVLALGAIVALSLLDSSSAWDAAELPSLLGTTTYYSATLLALTVAPGLAAAASRLRSRTANRAAIALGAISAVSALNNPLYLGWVAAPLVVALLVVAGRRLLPWRGWARAAIALAAGSAVGLLLRIPFAPFIARDTGGYADPGQALHVLFGYYVRLTVERASSVEGAASLGGAAVVIALAAVLLVRAIRRGDGDTAVLAAFGCLAPPIVLIGAVALGTSAYRYLEPCYFAPLVALVALPGRLPVAFNRAPTVRRRPVMALAALTAVGISVVAGTQIAAATERTDSSISCLTSWVTASHRIGAGRFFTIRGPKAYLADPRQLVQVNRSFDGYLWLVNRDDYVVQRVSFVVSDSTTAPPAVHPVAGAPRPTITTCGRYTITDYGSPVLPIGPLTSAYDP
jgi:hypothetical protein